VIREKSVFLFAAKIIAKGVKIKGEGMHDTSPEGDKGKKSGSDVEHWYDRHFISNKDVFC
jgi:hypothetical protein